ncbi:hypothetical protein M514_07191 [Trichuris suis]|uniref:DDE-1 domain-containing protein n=1 Tax=Trichuris suis TaxID=68888 RepID=A0A085NC04_9BILA|nr:hypothetical protein M513_07191 [Trichuris suis]KFD67000.1 hypothetical protein M514_07191 [Trichuris suis]
MDCEVFKHWFKSTFISEVKHYQKTAGKSGKVLLLIDNAPSHPSAESLSKIDELVTVKLLPPNVASLIQPMDQGVIAALKGLYRKQLLRYLLLPEDSSIDSLISFYKKMTLKDCCFMITVS